MSVFADTSALLAALVEQDTRHSDAAETWRALNESEEDLVTTNYVVLELLTLLQRRHGMTAVRNALDTVLLVISVHWLTPEQQQSALSAMLAAGRRDLSLVDCTSFVAMRDAGVSRAFTTDPHFAEQGFEAEPG